MAFLRSFAVLVATRSICANAASTHANPLGKAISMIEDLRTKVTSEGDAEAKTYDKFACACKESTSSKLASISAGSAEKDSLQAQINSGMASRDAQDQAIADAVKGIDDTNAEMEQARAERQAERHTYGKNEMDLTGAIQALNSAMSALKASKTAVSSLAELRATGHVDVVRRALQMAEMLSGGSTQKSVSSSLAALQLNDGPKDAPATFDVPASQYDFHSSDIVTTLEGLKTDFKAQKEELQTTETSAIAVHEKLVQDKTTTISEHTDALAAAKKSKSEEVATIASTSQDLTTTAAQLLDDQQYLNEISNTCNSKAVLWDQRKTLRADELQGLTKTLEVLATLNKKESLLAMRSRRHHHRTSPSLLQLEVASSTIAFHRHGLRHFGRKLHRSSEPTHFGRRARALDLLRSRARTLKSTFLLRLTRETSTSDPLAKVKTMIQELVERLLKEAADEASHKGWCDKEVALAEQKRGTSAATIAEANSQLAVLEARRAKLRGKAEALENEISSLEHGVNMSTTMREEEKLEHAEAIKEADEGKEAVTEALRILNEFYGAAAKAEVSFITNSSKDAPADEPLPDAGFDDVYVGAQSTSGSAVAMLEVLKSDFERTATMTAAAEKTSASDFLAESTAAESSLAAKGVAIKERRSQLASANTEDEEYRTQLKSQQDMLDKALNELEALQPACFGGVMTAEERKAKREEEIAALNQGLCILDNHGLGTSALSC